MIGRWNAGRRFEAKIRTREHRRVLDESFDGWSGSAVVQGWPWRQACRIAVSTPVYLPTPANVCILFSKNVIRVACERPQR